MPAAKPPLSASVSVPGGTCEPVADHGRATSQSADLLYSLNAPQLSRSKRRDRLTGCCEHSDVLACSKHRTADIKHNIMEDFL